MITPHDIHQTRQLIGDLESSIAAGQMPMVDLVARLEQARNNLVYMMRNAERRKFDVGLKQRVVASLEHGPKTLDQLEKETGGKRTSIRGSLSYMGATQRGNLWILQ